MAKKLLSVDDLLVLAKVEPDVKLRYGSHEEQLAHLYLPESPGPHPVVILIHGGCWRDRVNLDYFGQAAKALSKLNIAVWSLEYRRLGNGGGWPNTFLDVAKGANYLSEIASEYKLDLTRVISVGHSAGGHLALWLAARPHLKQEDELYTAKPLKLKGVVSLAGIPDIAEAISQNICQEAPEELMGGKPQDLPKRIRQGSPCELLPLGVPQILINGVYDEIVPTDYVRLYRAQARESGDTVRLEVLEDAAHFEIVVAGTKAWPTVQNAILELLDLLKKQAKRR